jgi:hypothetical protein
LTVPPPITVQDDSVNTRPLGLPVPIVQGFPKYILVYHIPLPHRDAVVEHSVGMGLVERNNGAGVAVDGHVVVVNQVRQDSYGGKTPCKKPTLEMVRPGTGKVGTHRRLQTRRTRRPQGTA